MKGNKGCANDTHQSQITTQYNNNVVLAADKRSWKHEKTIGDNRPGQQPQKKRTIKLKEWPILTVTH